jgi:murein DD-endopeptidase MepM/ murein hydrolase activator NlpD
VAVADGIVERIRESALGGLSVYFLDNGGTEYYYAHLDGYGDVSDGQAVTQGTVLGFVGSTGNAPPNTPHLHFEIHPGRGPAVDPYPTLSAIC